MKLNSDQKEFLLEKMTDAIKNETPPQEIVDAITGFVESLEPEEIDPTTTKVKYVGKRPFYEHREFGQWEADMVKFVPSMLAAKMLKHPDVFVKADPSDPAVDTVTEKTPDKEDDDNRLHDLRDQVLNARFKQVIVDIVKANYQNHDISSELDPKTAKVADYQRVALAHIDFQGTEGLI